MNRIIPIFTLIFVSLPIIAMENTSREESATTSEETLLTVDLSVSAKLSDGSLPIIATESSFTEENATATEENFLNFDLSVPAKLKDALLFSSVDSFFEFGTEYDKRLEELFFNFVDGLAKKKHDTADIFDFLRRECDELGAFLREKEELSDLRTNINQIMQTYQSKSMDSENLIEHATTNVLGKIALAKKSLAYLAPILAKYETYIRLLADKKTAQDKAVSFFFLFIVNPLVLEHMDIMPYRIKVARLLQKMIVGTDQVAAHKDFLAENTVKSEEAFRLLREIQAVFTHLPSLEPMFKEHFIVRVGVKRKPKKKSVIKWLGTTYSLDKHLAKAIYILSLEILASEKSKAVNQKGTANQGS